MSQLYMPWDTETGGFNENKADLLTAFFCIMDENYKILEELDLKLKPDDGRLPIAEAGALAVNKINIQEHLANPATVTYSEGRKQLDAMIRRHLKRNGRYSNISPMGYNCPFDTRWTQKHLFPQETWESLLHYKMHDVMGAVDFLKKVGWFPKTIGNLESVVNYLQIPTRNAHTAKDDTYMTIDVDKKLTEIMRSKKEGGQSASQDLITLLEAE